MGQYSVFIMAILLECAQNNKLPLTYDSDKYHTYVWSTPITSEPAPNYSVFAILNLLAFICFSGLRSFGKCILEDPLAKSCFFKWNEMMGRMIRRLYSSSQLCLAFQPLGAWACTEWLSPLVIITLPIKAAYISILVIFAERYSVCFIKTSASELVLHSVWLARLWCLRSSITSMGKSRASVPRDLSGEGGNNNGVSL